MASAIGVLLILWGQEETGRLPSAQLADANAQPFSYPPHSADAAAAEDGGTADAAGGGSGRDGNALERGLPEGPVDADRKAALVTMNSVDLSDPSEITVAGSAARITTWSPMESARVEAGVV